MPVILSGLGKFTAKALIRVASPWLQRFGKGPLYPRKPFDYSRDYGTLAWGGHAQFWEAKVKHLGMEGCNLVVDVGAGPGQWLPHLANLNKLVIGIEPNIEFLLTARRHIPAELAPRIALVQGVGEHLPLSDACVDALLCFNMIMYTNYRQLLKEVRRVLKDGGLLVIAASGWGHRLLNLIEGVYHRDQQAVRDGLSALVRFASVPLGIHQNITVWTEKSLTRILARFGFAVERVEEETPLPYIGKRYRGLPILLRAKARKLSEKGDNARQ